MTVTRTGDEYVVIRDGQVLNLPRPQVFRLDVLDEYWDVPPPSSKIEEVTDLRDNMRAADPDRLAGYIKECEEWLDKHDPVRRLAKVKVSAPRHEEEW